MLVNPQTQHLFLHNPKTGGTAVTEYLLKKGYHFHLPPEELNPVDDTINRHAWTIPPQYQHFRSWCVVRNPHWRFLSFYKFCVEHELSGHNLTYQEFARECISNLVPQFNYIENADMAIDIEDFQFVFPELPCLNKSKMQGIHPFITHRAVDPIYQRYRRDFEILNSSLFVEKLAFSRLQLQAMFPDKGRMK